MDNYGSLGLDQFLNAQDKLGANFSPSSGYEFDSQTERDSVNAVHLRNFSFNAGTGGTIVLGGAANGNGLLVVKSAAGGTICTINNNGITINSGSITINNSNGSTIIDSSGLNSLVTFRNDSYSGTSTITTTSSSFSDISGGSLTLALTRTTNVYIYYSGDISYTGTAGVNPERFGGRMALLINGTVQDYPADGATQFATGTSVIGIGRTETLSRGGIYGIASGTNNFRLQWASDTGGNQVTMNNRTLFYIVLGN